MTDRTVRVLLGDTDPASRAVLEPLCQEQGWELLVVESSFQILRMVRDTSDIALVLVNPALPGSGVSGRDVARTLKSSSQFGSIPVMFVLHPGQAAPEGVPFTGAIEIDRSGPARVLSAMREAMGEGSGAGDSGAPAQPAERVSNAPRAGGVAAPALKSVEPLPPPQRPAARATRIVVADTAAQPRSVLDPLFERQGWNLIGVESGFQVLRAVRDAEVDLVLINPSLQAAGVSGADIARTIKGSAQFRKLPVLFLLHEGQAAPQGAMVDGAVEVDSWEPVRIIAALNTAMGRPEDHIVLAATTAATPAPVELEEAEAGPTAPEPAPPPVAAAASATPPPPAAVSAEQLTQLREEMLGELRRAVDSVAKRFSETEAREAVEQAARRYAAAEGRAVTEQAVRAMAGDILPAAVDRLVREGTARLPEPTTLVNDLLPELRDEAIREIHRVTEAEGRALMERIIREYVAGEGRGIAEQALAAVAREILPELTARLVPSSEAGPAPAGRVDELLPQLREQLLQEARDAVETIAREHDGERPAAIEGALRQYIAGEGRGFAEQAITAIVREIVPALAERLVHQELGRLPSSAARIDELLPQIREQMLQEARRAVEAIARRYAETDGRATIESVIRQYAATRAVGLGDELIRAVARETVPVVAERLIRDEIVRLRREHRLDEDAS